ncbi:MAG: hypothetical protein ACXVH3_28140 [Solirubrobacteraceae bacterium]
MPARPCASSWGPRAGRDPACGIRGAEPGRLDELALLTARTVAVAGIKDASLHLITPELEPVAVFGAEPSAIVAELLAGAGIEFHGAT